MKTTSCIFAAYLAAVVLGWGSPALAQGGPVVSGPAQCGPSLPLGDLMHCENVLLDRADERMNKVYRALVSVLDERRRKSLVAAQRAWLGWRDGNFDFRCAMNRGEPRENLVKQVRWMRGLTEDRTGELAIMLEGVRAEVPGVAGAGVSGPDVSGPDASGTGVGTGGGTGMAATDDILKGEDFKGAGPPRVSASRYLDRLMGVHPLRLQWLGEEPTGRVEIRAVAGVLVMIGSQESDGQYLRIRGWIERVRKNSFTFRGTVTTRVEFVNGGRPCVRRGSLVFAVRAGRPYWRLQNLTNPCDKVIDYVDVFVAARP